MEYWVIFLRGKKMLNGLLPIFIFSVFFYSLGSHTLGASIGSSALLSNSTPTVSAVSLNNGSAITLTANATTTVRVNLTVTDNNGCGEVFFGGYVTTTVLRSGVGEGCTFSYENCYIATTTASSFTHSCPSLTSTQTSANATATFDIYYFAQATDASSSFPSNTWFASVRAEDASSSAHTASSTGIELNTLLAIDTTTSTNYGTVNPGENTSSTNQIVEVRNAGNASSALNVLGGAMTSGGNIISTSSQRYDVEPFIYGGAELIAGHGGSLRTSSSFDVVFGTTGTTTLSGVQAGDFLTVQLRERDGSAPASISDSVNGAWNLSSTLAVSRLDGNGTAAIYYYPNSGAGNPVFTITYGGSTPFNAIVAAWRGIKTTGSLNATNTAVNASATTHPHGNVTTTAASLILSVSATTGDGGATNAASNFSQFLHGVTRNFSQFSFFENGTSTSAAYATQSANTSVGAIAAFLTETILGNFVIPPQILGPSWTNTASMPSPHTGHGVANHKNYLYVLGGDVDALGTLTSTVRFATINSTGSLNSWVNTTPLPRQLVSLSAISHNGYLYTVGGTDDGSIRTTTVRFAPINATGSIGSWTNTTPLVTEVKNATTFIRDNNLYVVGGDSNSGFQVNVWRAPINATGSIGSWATTTPLSRDTSQHGMAVLGDYLYVVGGRGGYGFTSTVIFAPISATGSVGAWQNTASIPAPDLLFTRAEAVHGKIYVIGGVVSTNPTTTVWVSVPRANGTLGPWQESTRIPNVGSSHGTEIYKNNIYLIGGSFSGAFATSSVHFSKIPQSETYWGLQVANGTPAGTYSGTNTLTAIFAP